MKYTQHYSKKQTGQDQAIPGSNQQQNHAGGFSFVIDDFSRLERFLILGSDAPTYYQTARALTVENATCIERCLNTDPKRTIEMIVEVSDSGRAPKNDPAIFALAVAAGHSDPAVRSMAMENLSKVCRIGTHLFTFADNVQHFRGWGRSLRKAIGNWYTEKDAKRLALQLVKYQQRNGWSHRDLLRLTHIKPPTPDHQSLFSYAVRGRQNDMVDVGSVPEDLHLVWAFERAKEIDNAKELIKLITDYQLPHECVPNEFKKNPAVWEAMLPSMPLGALVRNLGRMSAIGLVTPGSQAAGLVVQKLSNQEALHKARIHPLGVLTAQCIYGSGHGMKGSLSWTPVNVVQDALEDAFYASFKNVEPTGQPTLIGLDVSGSMGGWWGASSVSQIPGLTPRVVSACMSMAVARTEPNYQIMAFSNTFMPLNITAKDSLSSVIQKISGLPFRGTDCALPMLWALQNKAAYVNYIIYTDNETWAGKIHPSQALQKVRKELNVPAKLAVVGVTATEFSIADQNDAGMMDFVGFDAGAPAVMANFFRS